MIYIACPEKFATGGTELLHQLCYKLNINGIEAKMYYYNKTDDNPIAERFLKYKIKYVEKIEDSSENRLIVPEVNIELLENYNMIQKSIWWLSVDNYTNKYLGLKDYFSRYYSNLPTFQKKMRFLRKYFLNLRIFKYPREKKEIFINKEILHLVQSYYAKEFLKMKEVEEKQILFLSDYLNDEFFIEKLSIKNRENIILYNPKKGMEITKKIMKKGKSYKFIPLINMTPKQIKELCLKSKIYIDFGNHPGKDRIPRETASLGCIVLTNKRGSAKYFQDVEIPLKYKYDENEIVKLITDIQYIFDNYGEVFEEYKNYRNKIKNEENIFNEEILKLIEFMEKK